MEVKLKGIFIWDGYERRIDRYGYVTVDDCNYDQTAKIRAEVSDLGDLHRLDMQRVSIEVLVLETRESGHIGDVFRGIRPSTPEVGEVFSLGEGRLDVVPSGWSAIGREIGLVPDDGRKTDWFDPHVLYKLHDQTVEITVRSV